MVLAPRDRTAVALVTLPLTGLCARLTSGHVSENLEWEAIGEVCGGLIPMTVLCLCNGWLAVCFFVSLFLCDPVIL